MWIFSFDPRTAMRCVCIVSTLQSRNGASEPPWLWPSVSLVPEPHSLFLGTSRPSLGPTEILGPWTQGL